MRLLVFLRFARDVTLMQLTSWPRWIAVIEHAYESTVGSLALVTVLSIFAGLNLSVQAYDTFARFGGQSFIGMFAGVGGLRELFPVMAAVICGARIGAHVTSTLAAMRIGQQIDALDVMSVDTIDYLVVPRQWALIITMPWLCAYATFVGLGASYVQSVHVLGLDPGAFWSQLATVVTLRDLWIGPAKGLLFGWFVAQISCFHGYMAHTASTDDPVGTATNRSIVHSTVACIGLNLLVSWWLYG